MSEKIELQRACENAKKPSDIEETSKRASEVETLPAVKEWIQTGCTILDFAIANRFPGGIPEGRTIHVFGGMSTCKTVLAATIFGYAQRTGRKTYYGDVEHTLDPEFAALYGFNWNETIVGYPRTLEEFFDDWIASIIYKDKKKSSDEDYEDDSEEENKKKSKSGKKRILNTTPKIIAGDSITALPAKIEDERKMDDQGYGAYRAKQLSLGFRKYIKSLAESNTTLLLIDQTRDSLGSPFGGETVTGGRAPEFYPSVRVYLKHDSKIVNSSGKVIGIWTKFVIKKNKVAPPFREGRFKILFDYGLDDIASNLYFLSGVQNGPKEAKNKSIKIKFLDQEMKMSSAIKYVEEKGLEEDLRKEVWVAWQKAHDTEERKPRKW